MGHELSVTFKFTTLEQPSAAKKDLYVYVNEFMDAFDCSFLFSLGHEIQSVFLKNKLCLATAPGVHNEFLGVSLTT